MTELMAENGVVILAAGPLVAEAVLVRHLDEVARRLVVGLLAAVADVGLGGGDERIGQYGIEQWAEPYLAGKHGGTLQVAAPDGAILSTLGQSSAQPADSVYLTIDRNLQINAQNCVQVCPMSIPLTRAIYETNRDITVNELFGWLRK